LSSNSWLSGAGRRSGEKKKGNQGVVSKQKIYNSEEEMKK
jgi:hypothetical protein